MAITENWVEVPEKYFYTKDLGEIYLSYKKQYYKSGTFNPNVINSDLMVALSESMDFNTPAKPDTIIAELKECYIVREYYRKLFEVDSKITIDKSKAVEGLKEMSDSITHLLVDSTKAQEYKHGESVYKYNLMLEERIKKGIQLKGYASSLPDLDLTISGWEKGKVYLVSGLEKLGKSRFVRMLISKWLKDGYGCAMFLLEENADAVHECILGERCRVNTQLMGTKNLSYDNLRKILVESQAYMNDPLYVSNKSGINPQYIKSSIQQQKIKLKSVDKELVFVIIDYIQRMQHKGNGKHEETENIASELANIARDENVCMIEVSQLTSQAEKVKGLPLHTQIRFGKVFKEAASCIITFDDPARMKKKDPEEKEVKEYKTILAHIIQREGVSDVTIELMAELQYSSFSNYRKNEEEQTI